MTDREMNKHTPRPWALVAAVGTGGTDCGWHIEQVLPDNIIYRGIVASVNDAEHIGGITVPERNANARLIAAAPDMLAALYEALEFAEDQEDVVDGSYGVPQANKAMQLAQTLREAISKAGAKP